MHGKGARRLMVAMLKRHGTGMTRSRVVEIRYRSVSGQGH